MEVYRVGVVRALVDSGASKSAISYEVIRNSGLRIEPVKKRWRTVDGDGRGIIGQMELTVEYGGSQIRLPEVIVFEKLQVPLILGIEWIGAANASIRVENQVGVVTLLDRGGEKLRNEPGSSELDMMERMQSETTRPKSGVGELVETSQPEGGQEVPMQKEIQGKEQDDDSGKWKEEVMASILLPGGKPERLTKTEWNRKRRAFHVKSQPAIVEVEEDEALPEVTECSGIICTLLEGESKEVESPRKAWMEPKPIEEEEASDGKRVSIQNQTRKEMARVFAVNELNSRRKKVISAAAFSEKGSSRRNAMNAENQNRQRNIRNENPDGKNQEIMERRARTRTGRYKEEGPEDFLRKKNPRCSPLFTPLPSSFSIPSLYPLDILSPLTLVS